jgi:hypothetical protein
MAVIAATMAAITLTIIALLELAKARRAIESVSAEYLRSHSTLASTERGTAICNSSSLSVVTVRYLSSTEPCPLNNRFSFSFAIRLPRHSVMPCWPAARGHTPHCHDPPTRSRRPCVCRTWRSSRARPPNWWPAVSGRVQRYRWVITRARRRPIGAFRRRSLIPGVKAAAARIPGRSSTWPLHGGGT